MYTQCTSKFPNAWDDYMPFECSPTKYCCSTQENWYGCCEAKGSSNNTPARTIENIVGIPSKYFIPATITLCLIFLLTLACCLWRMFRRRRRRARLQMHPSSVPLDKPPSYGEASQGQLIIPSAPPTYEESMLP